jgi:hypothetical protein
MRFAPLVAPAILAAAWIASGVSFLDKDAARKSGS